VVSRAFLLVLDSVGIGSAPDADRYGDGGADTVGHIADFCIGIRAGGALVVPNLVRLGLGEACRIAGNRLPPGLESSGEVIGQFGCAKEISRGKDTPSGHWEIAGVPVPFEWGYFPREIPCFPPELIEALCARAGVPGILGQRHASGTEIVRELGEEHLRTGAPICYTSADSVFQIAAHEQSFGLDRLYQTCAIARELVDPYGIGRVIARPFVGRSSNEFVRTANRRDYAVPPPSPTILDRASSAGRDVISIGKIADIFAHSGTGRVLKGAGNSGVFDCTFQAVETLADGGLAFANFIDFDTLYGHRRDPAGYAAALEAFDRGLARLLQALKSGDLLITTADHGCDPTWRGTDHTREQVPVLAFRPGIRSGSIGRRDTFADTAATIAAHLGLEPAGAGVAFQ
jgi:phosphopentomutase